MNPTDTPASDAQSGEKKRYLRHLMAQVLHNAHERGRPIDGVLAEFIVKYTLLCHRKSISATDAISSDEFQMILELCLNLVLSENDPITEALHLQSTEQIQYVDYNQQLETLQKRRVDSALQVFDQISVAKSSDALYSTLVKFITSLSSPIQIAPPKTLLPPETVDPDLQQAIIGALASVLPKSDVTVFRDMIKRDQATQTQQSPATLPKDRVCVQQLLDLADVANGIRILGSPSLQHIQRMLAQIAQLRTEVEEALLAVVGRMEKMYYPAARYVLETADPSDTAAQRRGRALIKATINRTCLATALQRLHRASGKAAASGEEAASQLRRELGQLQTMISGQEAIPKGQVYPKFASLSRHHRRIATAGCSLAMLRGWLQSIKGFQSEDGWSPMPGGSGESPLTEREVDEARKWMRTRRPGSRLQVLALSGAVGEGSAVGQGGRTKQMAMDTAVASQLSWMSDLSAYSPLDSRDITNLPLLMGGHCPVLLMAPALSRPGLTHKAALRGDGPSELASRVLVLPGSRKGDHRFLACSSLSHRALFMADPLAFLTSILATVVSRPEYAPLVLALDLSEVASLLQSHHLDAAKEQLMSRSDRINVFAATQFAHDSGASPDVPAPLTAMLTGGQTQSDPAGFGGRVPPYDVAHAAMLRMSGVTGESEGPVAHAPFTVNEVLSDTFLEPFKSLQSHFICQQTRRLENQAAPAPKLDLLGRQDDDGQVSSSAYSTRRQHTGVTAPRISDFGAQTPVHFLERRIVPDYTSSEWELRRRAVKLHRISKCNTHSTQTHMSTFRRAQGAQTIQTESGTTQTQSDASIHAKQHFRVVRGLRGTTDHMAARSSMYPVKVTPVELTLDPNDWQPKRKPRFSKK
eukprot:gnl/Dysnectes_brevis/6029_a9059_229.p1 GENE.gnl/Dysnectes_brevis/6029_a9059_229~~gnl/Dysnectes_brevis/6029_a9059_229.p1  ORF type:complete len:868 (-),score=272.66 gnl/Dysnectes_brevis/6029_a9059_229:45-2648(-)